MKPVNKIIAIERIRANMAKSRILQQFTPNRIHEIVCAKRPFLGRTRYAHGTDKDAQDNGIMTSLWFFLFFWLFGVFEDRTFTIEITDTGVQDGLCTITRASS